MKKLDLDIQLFATSGDFGEIVWGDAPYTAYHLVWWCSQSISGNYTDVTATLYFENRSGYDNHLFEKKIIIAGYSYNNSEEWISPTAGTVSSSATRRIYHDANGNGSAYISACDGNLGGWAYFNKINRYANFVDTHVQWTTIDTASFYVEADTSCNWCRYYLNGSSSWVDVSNVTNSAYAFDVHNLPANTNGYIEVEVRRTDNGLWTKSGRIYYTTKNYSRITSSVVNSNSDSSLKVTSSAPQEGANYHIYIELLNSNRTARIGEKIQHNNTHNTTFSIAELQSLANYIPNANSAKFRINTITIYNGKEYLDYKDGTYSVINANPTFSNFTYEDVNETTIGLTGNNQKIIKGHSNLKAKVSVSNKAVALKGATMSKYRLVVETKQIDVNYSSDSDVNLQLNNIDNNVFTLYAIDSRGNSTLKQISPLEYIEYFVPYFNSPLPNSNRTDEISSEVTLSFNGTFFNNMFGDTQNDVTLTYQYKKTSDSAYTDGTTPLTLTKNGNNFSFSNIIAGDLGATGFDASHSYNIRLVATDSLGIANYDFILGTGKPNLTISKNGIAINAPYDEEIGGDLQVPEELFLAGIPTSKPIIVSANDGTAYKYSNGLMICTYLASINIDSFPTEGYIKTFEVNLNKRLPSTFKTLFSASMQTINYNNNYFYGSELQGTTLSVWGTICGYVGMASGGTINVRLTAIGTWK